MLPLFRKIQFLFARKGHEISYLNMNDTFRLTKCPIWTYEDFELLDSFRFWVGGVLVCCVAVLGLALNLLAIGVLFRRFSAKNIFNQLITSLFLFDSIFLASQLINAFRWNFNLSTETHVLLFPYFLYPMTSISLTASIFMTVGIAHERYTAIRYPTQHRESMRSTTSRLMNMICLLYTSPSPRDATLSRMPSSA